MPIREYECEACGKVFEVLERKPRHCTGPEHSTLTLLRGGEAVAHRVPSRSIPSPRRALPGVESHGPWGRCLAPIT